MLIEASLDEDEVEDSVQATINPSTKGPKKRRLKPHKSDFVMRRGHQYLLKPGYDTKEFIRDSFYGKSYRKGVYEWRDKKINDPKELRHPTNKNLYWWKNRYWDKTKEYDEAPTVDHKKTAVVDHWNTDGRKTYQKDRANYFNDTSGCEVVPYSENSSMGAKLKGSYTNKVTITFRGPGEGKAK